MTRTLTLTLTLLVLLIALAGVPAGASGAVTVGLGDHSSGAFADPKFGALGLKRARKIVPWNVALRAGDRAVFDSWLAAARGAGIEPFVTFGAASGSLCPARPCSLPSIGDWRKAMRVFHSAGRRSGRSGSGTRPTIAPSRPSRAPSGRRSTTWRCARSAGAAGSWRPT